MAAKKQKSDFQICREGIPDSINRWKKIRDSGCSDPSWTDGCNMNLCRNHVISYKRRIREICSETGQPLPEEYYLPTPPEVSNRYMAKESMKQERRVERLTFTGLPLETGKVKYDETQLSFD